MESRKKNERYKNTVWYTPANKVTPKIMLTDPTRVSDLYIDIDCDYNPTFQSSGGIEPTHQKHYMKRERLVQEIRDMFKYPLAAYEKHQDLMKEEKRSENLEIKGKYRERLKALTDENVALKYELEQLKKKL
jgi:hypothetical protein